MSIGGVLCFCYVVPTTSILLLSLLLVHTVRLFFDSTFDGTISCPSAFIVMAPPTPSSHRPRKKRKIATSPSSNNNLILDLGEGKQSPAFPLVSFLWAARAGVSQWLILPLVLMAVGLFRWAVSLWGYSGMRHCLSLEVVTTTNTF